jgi:hypothetical protein
MRIYIDNYDVAKLNPKIHNLADNVVSSNSRLFILSHDGRFYTKHEDVFQIFIEKEDNVIRVLNYIKNVDVVVDNSIEVHKKVYSLPYEHVKFNTITLTIALNPPNMLKLVLVGKPKEQSPSFFLKKQPIQNQSNIDNIDILDFYFDTTVTDIANEDLKQSLNEFLSLLN